MLLYKQQTALGAHHEVRGARAVRRPGAVLEQRHGAAVLRVHALHRAVRGGTANLLLGPVHDPDPARVRRVGLLLHHHGVQLGDEPARDPAHQHQSHGACAGRKLLGATRHRRLRGHARRTARSRPVHPPGLLLR